MRKLTGTLEELRRFIGDVPDVENGWDGELRTDVLKPCESFEDKVKAMHFIGCGYGLLY